MLKGISPILSPDLLKALCEMGHGDEMMLADAHFPGHSLGKRVLRADGLNVTQMLTGIIPLLELDLPADSLFMMQPSVGDALDPAVEADFLGAIRKHLPSAPAPVLLARQAFYDRAKECFVIVTTGELRPYGNLLLRKGVTSVSGS